MGPLIYCQVQKQKNWHRIPGAFWQVQARHSEQLTLHDLSDAGFVCMPQADGEKLFKHFRPQFDGCDESLSTASALFCAFVFQKPPSPAPAGAPRLRPRSSHRRHAQGSYWDFIHRDAAEVRLYVSVAREQEFATHSSCCVCVLLVSRMLQFTQWCMRCSFLTSASSRAAAGNLARDRGYCAPVDKEAACCRARQ